MLEEAVEVVPRGTVVLLIVGSTAAVFALPVQCPPGGPCSVGCKATRKQDGRGGVGRGGAHTSDVRLNRV